MVTLNIFEHNQNLEIKGNVKGNSLEQHTQVHNAGKRNTQSSPKVSLPFYYKTTQILALFQP